MSAIETFPRIGPFMGVQRQETRTFENGRTFLVILYAAYNAFGLIGSECNGIAVLDEDRKQVVCDEIAKSGFGYNGCTPKQNAEFDRVCSLRWTEFQALVNGHRRKRYDI
jgi:hypothetical protein